MPDLPAEHFQPPSPSPRYIVVMGVSGSGKTTVGTELARILGLPYVDGDDFHPQANIDKMSHGIPLTDDDRWPWLERVGRWLSNQEHGGVIACSALKKSYRGVISTHCPQVAFLHCVGSKELLTQRMQQRTKHFMPTHLLDSQLATLEDLAPDESGAAFDISPAPTLVAERMTTWLDQHYSQPHS